MLNTADNPAPPEFSPVRELLGCFEELAPLETQCLVLRDACADALADKGHPDGPLLCDLKRLAHDLKYQIVELREKIAALQDELV